MGGRLLELHPLVEGEEGEEREVIWGGRKAIRTGSTSMDLLVYIRTYIHL